jgi:hypothetical protein
MKSLGNHSKPSPGKSFALSLRIELDEGRHSLVRIALALRQRARYAFVGPHDDQGPVSVDRFGEGASRAYLSVVRLL